MASAGLAIQIRRAVTEGWCMRRWLSLSVVLVVLRLSSAAATECKRLEALPLPGAEITLAEEVGTGTLTPSAASGPLRGLPAFCRVTGAAHPTPDSDIRFEVWMPLSTWNGKFVGVGNGAWAGSIPYAALMKPLLKGYATAATDTGHQGDALDARFARGHPERFIDFGYRGAHEMTLAAKTIIDAFYGRKAARSLFASCSTGGRQGLMEAYRYPQDYDAISAMAPANPMVALMASSLWTGSAISKDSANRLLPAQFALVHRAALAACDARDGVKDGIISAPLRCRFDPAALRCRSADNTNCLTPPQVAAMQAIYEGPRDSHTGAAIFPGFERGSEEFLPIQSTGTGPFPAVASYFRDLVFNDPNWDFRGFDYSEGVRRAKQAHSDIVDIPPQGLLNYLSSGRKLLLTHGWADPLVPPRSSVEFYEALPHAPANARLFMIPGMGHCEGGDGPYVFDPIAAIDEWVDTGRPPARIIVSNSPDRQARTRPICPFPQEAIYAGTGSPDDEKSFHCGASR
jgi:feruloyl esterase